MYQHLRLLLLFLITTSMLSAQETADIHFSLNECVSNFNGDNMDFSEFKSTTHNCTSLIITDKGLYRRNPEVNKHSCTPGVADSQAMCVEADQSCDYTADSDRAIRFEVMVEASSDRPSGISRIEFYQQAPVFFNWINGASGINNLPRRYTVRVTANGNEVYRMEDLFTSTSWNLRSFDFSNDSDFQVNVNTLFSFELTAYCPIDNGARVSIWDIDELSIYDLDTEMNSAGGTLTGGPFSFCVGDGSADNIPADGISLSANSGTNSQWVITDEQGNILGLPPTFSAVDFDDAGTGTCLV